MTIDEEMLPLPIDLKEDAIIKVMGVGGGGCNAVNYMYEKGIKDVSFLVCNTDKQALSRSSVPAKLQLGVGLGAGGNPDKAREYAEQSRSVIREALDDGTQMLFITAGMGGGTGTGASAIVAQEAQEMGILTVGIVTIPFAFEGKVKIRKAMNGVAQLSDHVDALLVINNEKLKQIYPELDFFNAFNKSDDVVCNAAKSIAEIITVPGYINTDFSDVYNTLKDGKVAIMNIGQSGGENRISQAITNALQSPLINANDVHGAKRILMQFYFSSEYAIRMNEIDQINAFIEEVGDSVEVQWGASVDDRLGEEVRVTIIATGYDIPDIPSLNDETGRPSVDDWMQKQYEGTAVAGERKDDEKPQQIDLSVPDVSSEAPSFQRQEDFTADEITIDFQDDELPPVQSANQADDKQTKDTSSFGWFRNKK